MSVTSISSLTSECIQNTVRFLEDDDFIPFSYVCKAYHFIIRESWEVLTHRLRLELLISAPEYMGKHKVIVFEAGDIYCNYALMLFSDILKKPQFPIENPLRFKKEIRDTLYAWKKEKKTPTEIIMRTSKGNLLMDLKGDPLVVCQTFQMLCDAGLVKAPYPPQPRDGYSNPSEKAVVNYSLYLISNATARQALDYLKHYMNMFEEYTYARVNGNFRTDVAFCDFIKRMSDIEFELFLNGISEKYIFNLYQDLNPFQKNFLFKTEKQFLHGLAMIKNYYCSIRGKLDMAQVIDTADKIQSDDVSMDEIEASLENVYELQTEEVKDLHEDFYSALIDYTTEEYLNHEWRDRAGRDKVLAGATERLSELLTDFTKKGGQLDENFIYWVASQYIEITEAYIDRELADATQIRDIRDCMTTLLFKRIENPSFNFVLFMVHYWLLHDTYIFLQEGESRILFMEVEYAPLVVLISKMNESSFQLLLDKINCQFMSAAVLSKRGEIYQINRQILSHPDVLQADYADEVLEKFATQFKIFLRASRMALLH